MSYETHITRKALQDMDDAASYIRFSLSNPAAAYELLVEAMNAIGSLTDFPRRNSLVDDQVLSSWGIRFIMVKNYIAFYTISEEKQTVYVVRFLYGKRNWVSILKQGFSTE